MNKYFKQYKWSNIRAMLRNQKKDPEICTLDFKGRLVVITGATSGIGYVTALKFASSGANILSINRNEEKSKKLCEELTEKYGVDCSYMLADFSKLKDVLFRLSATPLTINIVTGNTNGAIVGWSFESKAPVFNRLRDLPKSALTPIPGIYKASQWAYAPAGVPIAMLTGWYATQKIINKKKN
ncbi:MAG: SDR family NAD(P)-dependent oxidoreductase [Tenericutes bacterium]|nr:SDR family NAD(P)-dependent oxidoreductase [Mycoplasmatota bacterium]